MLIKAYAKINIGLNILGVREDGYHELDMVMLPLELHDTLDMNPTNAKDNYVVCDEPALSFGKYNLAKTAIEKASLKFNTKQHFDILIHKEIPVKAGLGGGSSNAAAVLRGYFHILKMKPTSEDVISLAKDIGADVPYCIYNLPSRVQGIGEKIQFIISRIKYNVLLVKPKEGLSTKDVFSKCDEKPYNNTDIPALLEALRDGNEEGVTRYMRNALEETAMDMLPEIKTIKESLLNDGLKMVMMSGSGSSVFALSQNRRRLAKLSRKYEKLGYDVILTKLL